MTVGSYREHDGWRLQNVSKFSSFLLVRKGYTETGGTINLSASRDFPRARSTRLAGGRPGDGT